MNLSPDIYQTTIKMILILASFITFMIVLLYLTKKISKKKLEENNYNLIEILDNKYIGVKKNISVIYIPNKIIVLGITNDNITLLSEINEKNIVEDILKKNKTKTITFYKHLQKWSETLKDKKKNNFKKVDLK